MCANSFSCKTANCHLWSGQEEEEDEEEAVPEFVAEDEIEESDLSDIEVRQLCTQFVA